MRYGPKKDEENLLGLNAKALIDEIRSSDSNSDHHVGAYKANTGRTLHSEAANSRMLCITDLEVNHNGPHRGSC
jgi:hypothetical protein